MVTLPARALPVRERIDDPGFLPSVADRRFDAFRRSGVSSAAVR
jgi:hypothetical protein